MSRLLWALSLALCFSFVSSSTKIHRLSSTRVLIRQAFRLFLTYQPELEFVYCTANTWTTSTTSENENIREEKDLFRTLVRLKSRLERFKKSRPQAAVATTALEEALHLYAAASVTVLTEEAAAEVADESSIVKEAEISQVNRQSQQGWLDWIQNLVVSPFGICVRDYFWTRIKTWNEVD